MPPPPMQYAHHERQPFNLSSHASQTTRTSRSPTTFNNLDHFAASVKMTPQMYDSYLAISPSGSSARETYPIFQSTGQFQPRQMVQDSGHHQPENPIARFITEESSWDPVGGGRHSGVLPINLGQLPSYNIYRNPTAPSESDTIGPATIISDSAYGSMPRQSVGIPSVYGDADHCAETQSIIQGVTDFQFHPGLSPEGVPSREDGPERKSWSQHGVATNSDTNELVCPFCKLPVKTKSELKKHEQRHSKPHRCDMDNCPRNGDGFSTLNDLARHKQTVHKIGGPKYRCDIGQCASKKKDWPRADNFKQHLVRVHNHTTNDLERFKSTITEPAKHSYDESSESTLPQPPVETHTSSAPVSHWDQTLTINRATQPTAAPDLNQLDDTARSSEGSPSLDGSILDDVDERLYSADQIPFDGMGLAPKFDQFGPKFETTSQHLPEAEDSPGQTTEHTPSFINPDILNHIGLTTSFSGDQAGPKDIRSQILELEPEGQATFNQTERESDFPEDGHRLPRSSNQAIGDFDQDAAADQDDLNDTDVENSGASDRAEHSPSPREVCEDDSPPPKAERESLGSDSRTASNSPDTMSLDETDASALVKDLMKKQVLDNILQQFGYRMVKETDIKDQSKEIVMSEPQVNIAGGRHACDLCNKSFGRPCELRKHRKRHDKPYACTYAQCDKRFGSKNDWKRHENSQHFQLECWKCNEKSKDSPDDICGKVCHRRETFTNHLEKDHGLDQKAIEGKWATCRVGRNCETRFWCGFCQTVVELVGRNGLAWTERFNHIDEHFNGRNGKQKADISEWKNVESEPSEPIEFLPPLKPSGIPGRPLSSDQSKKRRRSPSGDGSSGIRRKKFRAEDGDAVWTCCDCESMWNPTTMGTTICMSCMHNQCADCQTGVHKNTENTSNTLTVS